MEHTTIAVDLAKSVFQVAVSRRPGHVQEERRLITRPIPAILRNGRRRRSSSRRAGPPFLGAAAEQFGHTVRLLPAHDVHRYLRRNKTDRTDAKGLPRGHRNEEIDPCRSKTVEQQAMRLCTVCARRGSPPARRA